MSQQVPMYDPRTVFARKKPVQKSNNVPKYIPKEDGFITTSGNAELGKKWGNGISSWGNGVNIWGNGVNSSNEEKKND